MREKNIVLSNEVYKYILYQVQLETRSSIYCFEVGTNEDDAIEYAEAYLAEIFNNFGPFHIGGYCSIGNTNTKGVVKFRNGG